MAAFRTLSVIWVASLHLSFADDHSCLMDAQSSDVGTDGATKCQALLQSGLRTQVSAVADPRKKLKTFKSPEEDADDDEEASGNKGEKDDEDDDDDEGDKDKGKKKGYLEKDFVEDDPPSQRLGQYSKVSEEEEDSFEKDLVKDDNRGGKPNKLEEESMRRKRIKAKRSEAYAATDKASAYAAQSGKKAASEPAKVEYDGEAQVSKTAAPLADEPTYRAKENGRFVGQPKFKGGKDVEPKTAAKEVSKQPSVSGKVVIDNAPDAVGKIEEAAAEASTDALTAAKDASKAQVIEGKKTAFAPGKVVTDASAAVSKAAKEQAKAAAKAEAKFEVSRAARDQAKAAAKEQAKANVDANRDAIYAAAEKKKAEMEKKAAQQEKEALVGQDGPVSVFKPPKGR